MLQDKYGLHRPIVQHVSKATTFCKLDTRQAILQMPIAPEHQACKVKWVGNKLRAYSLALYGFKKASAYIKRVVDYDLSKAELGDISVAFTFNVLIRSESPQQHVKDIAAVLDMLDSCGLRAHSPYIQVYFWRGLGCNLVSVSGPRPHLQ